MSEEMKQLNEAELDEVTGGKHHKSEKTGRASWSAVDGKHCPVCQSKLLKKGDYIACNNNGHYWKGVGKSNMTYENLSGTDASIFNR